jgi:hypothetical protein
MDQTAQLNAAEFQRAYAQLQAMKSNIPGNVTEPLLAEYNGLVDRVRDSCGLDVSKFRIANSELRRVCHSGGIVDFNRETHRNFFGPPECDRDLFLRRIDGLLMYLESQNATAKPVIGFANPPIR